MGDLIEINLTASEPIIGVIYYCFMGAGKPKNFRVFVFA